MNKIQGVVAELARRNLFAVVVPTADPHNSEYVAACFQRRANLCGFRGSAGTCVVTSDSSALLWTDGRYWLEADQTLDKGWTLMKQGHPDCPSIEDWLLSAAQKHLATNKEAKIGIDASTQLWSGWRGYVEAGLDVVATEGVNIIDTVLNEGGKAAVPPVVKESVIPLDIKYTGKSVADKIDMVASALTNTHRADMTLMSSLDEVAWLLNLRCPTCCDIPFAPTFFAFAVVTCNGGCYVFMEEAKLNKEAKAQLEACSNIVLLPYTALPDWLSRHSKNSVDKNEIGAAVSSAGTGFLFGKFGGVGLLAETSASYDCYRLLTSVAGLRVRALKAGIVEKMKAVKNATELKGFRDSHVRDGVALTRYIAWLTERMNDPEHPGTFEDTKKPIDELGAAARLLKFRAETGGGMFMHASFGTISAAGGNAAIVHYNANPEKPTVIKPGDMYLCDSGGQYYDGTTDVTRTMVFARTPPEHWRRAYTLVLKGHIRLNTTYFPKGTTGFALNCLARLDLWKHGLDYRHGTGHGVGHCLNVHEGPHGIGLAPRASDPGLTPGNIVSNEPGFYVSNEFGIRIENLDVITEAPIDGRVEYPKFENVPTCRLESLTRAPLCRALIVKEMLTEEERLWINNYHRLVFNDLSANISSKFDDFDRVTKFLTYECAPL